MQDAISLLKKIISIPSVTGNEQDVCLEIFKLLSGEGFKTTKISVSDNRFDIVASVGSPKIYLSAHLDTVSPYIPLREDSTHLYGRGSCDTKSSVAAMITAGISCKNNGLTDFGLIFTVGEEGDFDGAIKVKESNLKIPFIVVGEPTSLEIVNGHFGMLVLSVTAKGKACHSSQPEKGINAIDKLLNGIEKIKNIPLDANSLMSLVKVSGGIADNIIPPEALAAFSFRIHPQDKTDYKKIIKSALGSGYEVKEILNASSVYTEIPKQLSFIKKNRIVKYGTDLSILKNGVVIGPGDIKYAHGDNEQIKKSEIVRAVGIYSQIIKNFVLK